MRFSKKLITILFNSAAIALSTFLSTWILRLSFGDFWLAHSEYLQFHYRYLSDGPVQYGTNSGLVAIATALNSDHATLVDVEGITVWTSLTYFRRRSAPVSFAKLFGSVGLPALSSQHRSLIIFITYQTYLKKVETGGGSSRASRVPCRRTVTPYRRTGADARTAFTA